MFRWRCDLNSLYIKWLRLAAELMQLLNGLRQKVLAGLVEFSEHATDRSIRRDISVEEVREAIISGEVIEDYPEDRYGPSCIIFGRTKNGRPLHVQVSYPSRPIITIITIYEPDPSRWIDYRIRKSI